MEIHYKNGEQSPVTACEITDKWVIWSKHTADITCVKCVDVMELNAP